MPTYVINGTTGATGSIFIREMARCMGSGGLLCSVRASSDTSLLDSLGLRTHVCELNEPGSYRAILGPSTVYVALVGIKTAFFPILLDTLIKAGVRRALFLGSTYVLSQMHPRLPLYRANEDALRASGLSYTLCRPSMIYGSSPNPNAIHRLLRAVSRTPVMPVIGKGDSLMQPVHAADLASALLAALGDGAIGKEYVLAGPQALPYREIIYMAARVLGRKVAVVSVPEWLAAGAVGIAKRLRPRLPISVGQIKRLREDKAFDISAAREQLGFDPRPLEQGMREEAGVMRQAGLLPAKS